MGKHHDDASQHASSPLKEKTQKNVRTKQFNKDKYSAEVNAEFLAYIVYEEFFLYLIRGIHLWMYYRMRK